MAKTILGNKLVNGLNGGTDSTQNMTNFVNIIADFISTNVTLIGVFNGVTTSVPPTPSGPIATNDAVDSSLLKNQVVSCAPPSEGSDGIAEWIAWITSLYTLISTTVMYKGTVSIPISPLPAFPTMIVPSWSRNDLRNVVENGSNDVQGDCMDVIANGIVNDLKTCFLPTIPATVAAFTGATVINSVNVIN